MVHVGQPFHRRWCADLTLGVAEELFGSSFCTAAHQGKSSIHASRSSACSPTASARRMVPTRATALTVSHLAIWSMHQWRTATAQSPPLQPRPQNYPARWLRHQPALSLAGRVGLRLAEANRSEPPGKSAGCTCWTGYPSTTASPALVSATKCHRTVRRVRPW